MIKQVSRVDEAGFFIEPVLVDEKDTLSPDLIKTPVPEGFYKPRWDGTQWVEGMSEEEFNQLKANQPEPSPSSDELKLRVENVEGAVIGLMDWM
ncbi:hypothetical protein [Anoxybacteroides tepidamans]|uniref:hypothetical protein n=1 Tax=Anoxybacteroides tepidamans TaxID=265948 RepID=UPI000481AAE2|nr:hypothetical protein [Anoxybacillus tepidamans]